MFVPYHMVSQISEKKRSEIELVWLNCYISHANSGWWLNCYLPKFIKITLFLKYMQGGKIEVIIDVLVMEEKVMFCRRKRNA